MPSDKPTLWPSRIYATLCRRCATFRLWVTEPSDACSDCRRGAVDRVSAPKLYPLRLIVQRRWPAQWEAIDRVWKAAAVRMWAIWHNTSEDRQRELAQMKPKAKGPASRLTRARKRRNSAVSLDLPVFVAVFCAPCGALNVAPAPRSPKGLPIVRTRKSVCDRCGAPNPFVDTGSSRDLPAVMGHLLPTPAMRERFAAAWSDTMTPPY